MKKRKPDPMAKHHAPGPHYLRISAQDAPGVFEVRCSCYGLDDNGQEHGFLDWTPWGEEHAIQTGEMHLEMAGEKPKAVFHMGRGPK